MAKARRIATRAHRGQLFRGDGLFVEHLQRVADTVTELTGSPEAVQAAWLYAVPQRDVPVEQLYRQGFSAAAVRIVECLQQRQDEYPPAFTARILHIPQAAAVRFAVLTELRRVHTGKAEHWWWREQYTQLAHALGRTIAEPAAATDPGPADQLIPPVGDEHWGAYARHAGAGGDIAALPVLLAGYQQLSGTADRRCRLAAMRGAIWQLVTAPANATAEPVLALAAQWWDADDEWEDLIAVSALAAGRTSKHRRALLGKLNAERPAVVTAAIKGLDGDSDPFEIAQLGVVVNRPDPLWRWARRAAVSRLTAIGGPAAEDILHKRYLSYLDPPWRDDPDWLRLHGPAIVPLLMEKLSDPAWLHEAAFALGELHAIQAVPAICEAAQRSTFPIWAITALGKIGSADAVATLLDCMKHANPEVRDHALRALLRVGDPRMEDAAIIACDDPHPMVRDRAARILTRHCTTTAVPQLIRLCDGSHAAAAAAALARIGDPRALPTLWKLFRDATDRVTRHAAGRGLARIDGRKEYVHDRPLHVQRAYIWLLGHKPHWKPDDALTRALADDDPITRARAAQALARLGITASAELLQPLLADPDHRVRAATSAALIKLATASRD